MHRSIAFLSPTPRSFSTRRTHRPNICLRPQACIPPLSWRPKIPMALTYARVAAIPLLCCLGLSSTPHTSLSAFLFAISSLTDFLDGYLARRWNVVSPMGTFLDPVADKLIVAVALTLITARFPTRLIVLSTAIIVSREIFVSALREWMAILGQSAQVKVSFWGKLKTATQMLALTILLFATNLVTWYARLGLCLLVLAAVLSFMSATEYIRAAQPAFSNTPS